MLRFHGIRESRIFKEGFQDGFQEGLQEVRRNWRARVIQKMIARGDSVQAIAEFFEIDVETVKNAAPAVPPMQPHSTIAEHEKQ